MPCNHCNSNDHTTESHYKLMDKIPSKGYPQSSPKYKSAHNSASRLEKERFPKGYKKLIEFDKTLPQGELAGKSTKSGKLEVSKKVPKQLRKEVSFHEKEESKRLRKKK